MKSNNDHAGNAKKNDNCSYNTEKLAPNQKPDAPKNDARQTDEKEIFERNVTHAMHAASSP
jgi:hypothetical protein